jgi:GT2 family glycosyltransferase/SAM-dependent methyltransferase/lambda repressor-like predicted transcriptional regulator
MAASGRPRRRGDRGPIAPEILAAMNALVDLPASLLVGDAYVRDAQTGVFRRPAAAAFRYNDGDRVEEAILRIVRGAADVSAGSDELARAIHDWPTLYHFSPQRASLLRPLEPMLRGRSVLELGAGCGAVSRYLAELGGALTCVEGSARRAAIVASRCRGLDNVRVVNDNFQHFQSNERYDVVTLIGVLEYSRSFLQGEDPVASALALARSFLKDDGVLLVAIENKLGLKYWAGAPEDHLGLPFVGVESLYGARTAVTFGRRELEARLRRAGFGAISFFYPFPDYKLPSVVLDEAALGEAPEVLINLLSPCAAPNQAADYARTLSEGAAWRALVDNGLVGDLANSFLVVAGSRGARVPAADTDLAFVYSSGRRKALSHEVRIVRGSAGLTVRRRPLHGDGSSPRPAPAAAEPLLPGELLFNRLLEVVNRRDWGVPDLVAWLGPLLRTLKPHAVESGGAWMLPGRYVDATPFNLIGRDGEWQLFDLEWPSPDPVSLARVLFRGVHHSLARVGSVATPRAGTPLDLPSLAAHVLEGLLGTVPPIDELIREEVALQSHVLASPPGEAAFRGRLAVRGTVAVVPPSAQVRSPESLRLAVVLHLFYPELWSEFEQALAELPAHTRLFVTTPHDKLAWVRRIVLTDRPTAVVVGVSNRGRDLGPLVTLLASHDLARFDYVLKLHSKRSPHLGPVDGQRWRRGLLQRLLPRGAVPALLGALERAPEVGLAGPAPWLAHVRRAAGFEANEARLRDLARRIGSDGDPTDVQFMAGTMFWVRGAVLAQLQGCGLTLDDFEPEAGQLDGTLAHALERGFALLARRAGLRVAALPELTGAADLPASERGASGQLKRWLAEREPDVMQAAQIRARLASTAAATGLTVCVLDRRGDADAVRLTCDSLRRAAAWLPSVEVVVVGAAAPVPDVVPPPRHRATEPAAAVDALNAEAAHGDTPWLLLAEAGDIFTETGLARVALELAEAEGCRAVFADELVRAPDGSLGAMFRPAVNLDLLLSFPASMARHVIVRRSEWRRLGGLDARYPQALELDLVLRMIDDGGLAGLGHVAEPLVEAVAPAGAANDDEPAAILAHLRRRGYALAQVTARRPRLYRVDYGHAVQPLVSIVVPTRDQLPMLRRCVESLLEKTRYPHYELLIVDNDSQDREARAWLDGVAAMGEDRVRVLSYAQPFNFSAINNMAVREARGEVLVLLNNDTAVLDPGWLDAMLNHALRPEVGAVGAKLLYPDGRVQHAGVVLGLRGPAEHAFAGELSDAVGSMHRLAVDQDYSAVTAACMMIRREVWDAVGGMDEQAFAVSYNDVDLCLKVGTAGWLNVWTPDAVLLHEGSVSQKRVDDAAAARKRDRFVAEQDALYAKWLPQIARDPAYNPNLSLTGRGFDFEADVSLVCRPLPWRPLPVVLAHPADRHGCGEYRVLQPMRALRGAGLVDGVVRDEPLLPAELARLDPDVVVLQRQIGAQRLDAMRRIGAFSRAFKVYELDDYLPQLPLKSAFRAGIPKDALRSLRRGLGHVDRFVVSTPALAEAFEGLHADIRVVKNRLSPAWWDGLTSRRRRGRKPRVGWAGGAGHGGDLELIVDVVKALADEVEWVFFGLCPDPLLDLVHEVHAGVEIERYPARLASLDLDLGLAPLEDNLFNACKSNLRLLEYGVLGIPVVCSDLRCYREDGLPVTRIKSRYKDWVDAIRAHTHDLDHAARLGDALRERVRADWMLQGEHLQPWLDAWTRR